MSEAEEKNNEQPDEDAIPTADFSGSAVGLGGQIGAYKLLSILGEGGFAEVYLAEQQKPVKRQAALKVIKPGMDSKEVIARFEAERQALALLDHPNVAHVYEAGTTELGRPYFVMEYVKGVPITEHCDRHKLTIEERLKLFLQVCEAVQHAHQKGIIHRDIKPSNILILFEGQRALSKVIDFGIAKAISQPLTERTLFTEQGQMIGTPEYMSPEQAEMTTQDIDTRSDIYSLGVLLYELMTGVLPFEAEELRKGGLDHIRTVIREQEPRTPSTRLSRLTHEESTKLAQHRRAEAQLISDFLENDVLGSVREARVGEATVSYILDAASKNLEGKFKDRPLIEARISEKLGWTYRWIGESTKAEPHMLNAIRIYQQHYGQEHAVTLGAMDKLGWVYANQGRYHEMERLLNRNLQIRQRVSIVKDQMDTLNALGTAYYHLGKFKEAVSLREKVLQIVRLPELGEENVPDIPFYRCNLAAAYAALGRYGEAERLFVETLETAEWPERHSKWWGLAYTRHLADMYREQGRYNEAEPLFVKTLEMQRLVLGNQHLRTLVSMYGLARLYTAQNRYEEAENLFTEMLEIAPRQLGEEHPKTLGFMNGFAVLLTKQKRYDEAEPLFKKALEGRRQKLDEEHPATLESKNDLAVLYKEQGRYDEAEPFLLEAVEGRMQKLGEQHPHTLDSMKNLIELYEAWGKPEKAEEWRAKLPGKEDKEEQ